MVSESHVGPFATLESIRTAIDLTRQSVTVRRGDVGFDRLADAVDEGSSAEDGPVMLLFTDRAIYTIMADGQHAAWDWGDGLPSPEGSDKIGPPGDPDPGDAPRRPWK